MDKEIDPPEILSAQLTVPEFEAWKNKLITYLKQDSDNKLFLEYGPYANWSNMKRKRIQQINRDFEVKTKNILPYNTDKGVSLLLKRNGQLDDFIELICELSNHLGEDAIKDHATSFEKMLNIIEGSLSPITKNESIVELSKLKYNDDEKYESFYQRMRTMISEYTSKNYVEANDGLLVEEIISPTFEEVIILWCLEKVDQELPILVEHKFGLELRNSSLYDLKDDIFLAIPDLLKNDDVLSVHETPLDVDANGKTNVKMESVGEKTKTNDEDNSTIEAEPIIEILVQKTPNYADNTNKDTSGFIYRYCEMCDSHISSATFREHGKICLIKKHPCNLCDKVFYSYYDYQNHTRTHDIPKFIECEICLFRITLSHLDKHREKQHTNMFCCGKFFTKDINLYIHKKSHRVNDFKFYCHGCCTSLVSLEDQLLHGKNCVSSSVNASQSSMVNFKEKKDVYPEEQVFINIEPKRQTEDPSDEMVKNVTVNGVKFAKKTFSREDYSCIVCQKILSSRENLKIHMHGHFPGAENTELFAQLMANMKPVKVYESLEFLMPVPPQDKDPFEGIDLKLEVEDVEDEDGDASASAANKKIKLDDDGPDNIKKEYSCEECNKVLSSERAYKIHKVKHFGCICDECGASFGSIKKLNYHSKTKHNSGENTAQFVCSECGKSLCNKLTLLRHMERRHAPKSDNKEYSCELCGDLFNFEWQLKNHLASHKRLKKRRDLMCQTCKRSFITDKDLSDHVCKHYSCDICDTKFLRERNLNFHKRLHSGETIYDCNKCEAIFATKRRLNSHKNTTHSDKKKWVCSSCPRAFKTSSGLKQHVLGHTGEKPVKCDVCDASFKTKAHLKSHRMIHNNELPHQCNGCGLRFRELTSFKVHREKNTCGISDQDRFKAGANTVVDNTSASLVQENQFNQYGDGGGYQPSSSSDKLQYVLPPQFQDIANM